MSMCRFFSCVLGRGCLLWPVHSLGKTPLAFALFHFVIQGQTCPLLQVSLEFLLLHFFFLGMVLITASCTVSQTSVHNSWGTLLHLVPGIYLSLPLYNHKIFDLGYLVGLVVFPIFFTLSLNFAIRSSGSEPQSAPSLAFADCIERLHLRLQRI